MIDWWLRIKWEQIYTSQIIIEKQVQDRKTLPEWQELERKTVEKMEQILVDPRYKHLYREFPGGN